MTRQAYLSTWGKHKIDPQMLDCEKVFALGRSIPKTSEMGKGSILELLKGPYVFEKQADLYLVSKMVH